MRLRVSNPPSKPLLLWDGECDFCRLWIERWKEITAGKIDYAAYQEEAEYFPEISRDEFKHSMVFAHAWDDLSDRIRVALGTSGWIDRQRRDVASESIPTRGPGTTWTGRVHSLANALLA